MASEGVLATLQAGWQALGTCGAERAVIGGLALSAWNHARSTRDADVLTAIDRGRIDELSSSDSSPTMSASGRTHSRGRRISQLSVDPVDFQSIDVPKATAAPLAARASRVFVRL